MLDAELAEIAANLRLLGTGIADVEVKSSRGGLPKKPTLTVAKPIPDYRYSQPWEYCHKPHRRQPFYAVPRPDWVGNLALGLEWLAPPVISSSVQGLLRWNHDSDAPLGWCRRRGAGR
jgi:hypothetical protein